MLTTRHLIPRRQLSAIMFVDMVGYSAMMQGDENSAYQARARYRTALKGATQRCHGEIIQHYGDGALVLFRSAVEGTRAALQIQQELRTAPRVLVRIGLHLADVVRDDEGAYGAGINVAARVEALAVPGSVLISDRVAREIQNHPDVPSRRLGEFSLKNIDSPVGIHALDHEDLVVPDVSALCVTPLTTEPNREEKPAAGPAAVPGWAGFLYELHRRRVFQVAVGYLVVVLATLGLLVMVGPGWGLPAWSVKAVLSAAAMGFPITLKLAWTYDVTPMGIRRTGPSPLVTRGRGTTMDAALVALSLFAGAALLQSESLALPGAWAQEAPVVPALAPESVEPLVPGLRRPAPLDAVHAGGPERPLPGPDPAGQSDPDSCLQSMTLTRAAGT